MTGTGWENGEWEREGGSQRTALRNGRAATRGPANVVYHTRIETNWQWQLRPCGLLQPIQGRHQHWVLAVNGQRKTHREQARTIPISEGLCAPSRRLRKSSKEGIESNRPYPLPARSLGPFREQAGSGDRTASRASHSSLRPLLALFAEYLNHRTYTHCLVFRCNLFAEFVLQALCSPSRLTRRFEETRGTAICELLENSLSTSRKRRGRRFCLLRPSRTMSALASMTLWHHLWTAW
jgi:hypothetical protein